jgi:hypothetical protein
MKGFFVLCCASLFSAVSFFGCAQAPTAYSASGDNQTGQVQLLVKLGKVGSLAKTAEISLDSLVLVFFASGEADVRRNIPISGHEQQTVNLTVELAANKSWTVSASTYDNWSVIHSGSANFNVVEGSNPAVSLALSANYSMLMVRISPLPDSATYVALSSGSELGNFWPIDDTTFSKGPKLATDTAKLFYDFFPVNNGMSSSQDNQVAIRGTWNGVENIVLYWGTVNIPLPAPGQDASYSFNLNWVGPSSVFGQVPIEATIGRVGSITVDGVPIIQ